MKFEKGNKVICVKKIKEIGVPKGTIGIFEEYLEKNEEELLAKIMLLNIEGVLDCGVLSADKYWDLYVEEEQPKPIENINQDVPKSASNNSKPSFELGQRIEVTSSYRDTVKVGDYGLIFGTRTDGSYVICMDSGEMLSTKSNSIVFKKLEQDFPLGARVESVHNYAALNIRKGDLGTVGQIQKDCTTIIMDNGSVVNGTTNKLIFFKKHKEVNPYANGVRVESNHNWVTLRINIGDLGTIIKVNSWTILVQMDNGAKVDIHNHDMKYFNIVEKGKKVIKTVKNTESTEGIATGNSDASYIKLLLSTIESQTEVINDLLRRNKAFEAAYNSPFSDAGNGELPKPAID